MRSPLSQPVLSPVIARSFSGASALRAWLALALAWLTGALGTSVAAAQSVAPCFGPQAYSHVAGGVEVFQDVFDAPNPGAPYVLRIKNGDRQRLQRLAGVRIEIDGVPQFCGDDITAQTPIAERVFFASARRHTLGVELSGPAAGFITVDVRPLHLPAPFADAGEDQTVAAGSVVMLDGRSSRAASGSTASYAWELLAQPAGSAASLQNANAPQASFVAEVAGLYVARIVVSSGALSAVSVVSIQALSGPNQPPVSLAGLDQTVEVGESAVLDGTGSFDPEGLPITYQWTVGGGPPGHNAQLLFDDTATPTFIPDLQGMYVVKLVVNDGVQDCLIPDRTRITVIPFNGDPIANAGPDQNVTVGALVQLDGTGSSDPENQPLTFDWSFTFVPPGSAAAFDDSSSPTPTFTADVAGPYVAQLVVSDGLEFSAPDEVLVTAAGGGQVNVPNVVGLPQAQAQDALLSAGLTIGQITVVQSAAVPVGSVADQNPAAGASVPALTPVALDVAIGAPVDIQPPIVHVTATPSVVSVGENVMLTITATDNVGVTSLVLEVNGAPVAFDISGNATFVPSAEGLHEVRGEAGDAAGLTDEDRAFFSVRSAVDNGPPSAALTAPADDTSITAAVDLIGTASDVDLVFYELQAAPASTSAYVTFRRETTPVSNGVLGRLDPCAFRPGVYDVRVCATDSWGATTCSAPKRYELARRNRAPGQLNFSFLDGLVDVVGLPITVRRIYDGSDKTVGDFGVGWRLETDDVRLETTRVMGADWQIQKVGTFLPTYFLNPSKDHRVNVFLPDGTVHRFRMRPDPSSQQLFPFDILNGAFFDPLAGVTSTLTPNDTPAFVLPVITSNGPVQLFDFSLQLYNPTAYTLNLADGRRLTFAQDGSPLSYRLTSIRDSNGNTLSINANGFAHSAGASIGFTRDAQGRITTMTSPAGDVRTYGYDAAGDLVQVVDYEGFATQFVYDDAHNLVRVIDPRGFTPGTLIYNDAGQIVAMIDAQGERVDLVYDTTNNQQIVTDRLGHTTINGFDNAGNLVAVTDPLGNTSTFTYDADGNMLTSTDPLGGVQTMTYNAQGLLLTHTDERGGTMTRTYNSEGELLTETDRLGAVTTLTRDANGNVTQVQRPGGAVINLAYNAAGALTSVTDAVGGMTTFTRDPLGQVTAFSDPLGRSTNVDYRSDGQLDGFDFLFNSQVVSYDYEYDSNGNLSGVTMPDGTSASLVLDGAGLPMSTTDTSGASQQMTHDAEFNLLSLSDHDGSVTALDYDAESRLAGVDLPGGRRVDRTMDPLGRPTDVTMPGGVQISTQYDAAGHVIGQQRSGEGPVSLTVDAGGLVTAATDGTARTTHYAYDANGQLTSTTSPGGGVTQHQYDADGNHTTTTQADGTVISYERDVLGRLTAVQDPAGTRIEYSYDIAGQLTSTFDPAGGSTNFDYDEMGSLETATSPTGKVWSFAHDSKGQVLSQTYPWGGAQGRNLDSQGRITRLTDPTGEMADFVYDAAGRLTSTTLSTGGVETRNYDASGRLTSVIDTGATTSLQHLPDGKLARVDHPNGDFVQYTYDAAGRVASVQTPGGTTSYSYDAAGRLTGVNDTAWGATSYVYDADGQVSNMTLADGSQTLVTRNVMGAITALTTTAGTSVVRDSTYGYDIAGKLANVVDLNRTANYAYDAGGRLQSETRTGADAGSLGYAFDGDWNVTQIGARTLMYDNGLRILSDGAFTGYVQNASGRPASRSNGAVTEQFEYDAVGRLVGVTRIGATPSIVELEYDHAGLLRRVVADGVGRTYLWDSSQEVARLLEERTDGGALIRRYVHGLGPIGVFDGATHVLHRDPTGAVRVITNAAGSIESEHAFTAFGEPTLGAGGTISQLRWSGELFVPELGMYFLRSRYYDPVAARFLSPDLFEPVPFIPVTYNPFQYGNGDPVNFRDPNGNFSLSSVSISMNIVGILAGLAFSYFGNPLSLVVSGLVGEPPGATYPVGGDIGIKASAGGFGGIGSLSAGAKIKVRITGQLSLASLGLEAGVGLQIPPPAALVSRRPSISYSVGIAFGVVNGPPSVPPSPSYSLQVSGNIATRVANKYTETVINGILPGFGSVSASILAGSQQFEKSSAAISFKLGQPSPGKLRDVFSVSLSNNLGPSTGGSFVSTAVSALGGFNSPIYSNYSPNYIFGGNQYTAGLSFNAYLPLCYVTYGGGARFSGGCFDW